MGGCCCCASKSAEGIGESPIFHYTATQEDGPPSNHAAISDVPGGVFFGMNPDASIPDTYQPPPAPIPYETYHGCQHMSSGNDEGFECKHEVALQPTNAQSVEDINAVIGLEAKVKNLKSDGMGAPYIELEASKEVKDEYVDELKKSSNLFILPLQEEEDTCPICLEEYDEENPKMLTKCNHHFHLACILEWMERSDTCPVCDQEMVFSSFSEG